MSDECKCGFDHWPLPCKDEKATSDTPETDEALRRVWYCGDHGSAIPALCRKLERERNAALEEVKRLNWLLRAETEKQPEATRSK